MSTTSAGGGDLKALSHMKKPIKNVLSAATIALVTLPAAASAWTSFNMQKVVPLSERSFEVQGRPGASNTEYWCAAGDYAFHVLDLQSNQRIYVSQGQRQSRELDRKLAVQFSLDPPPDGDTSWSLLLSVNRVGENLSMTDARNYCMRQRSAG